MRIVYGVSGEGLGHVYEAIEIAGLLRSDGHAVKIVTFGDRALDALGEFRPTRIEGLPLHFNERGLSVLSTVFKNAHFLPFFARNWGRLKRELDEFAPDAFITAYEPYTTLMAHVLGRPLVSMDNQNALLHRPEGSGGHGFPLALARLATRVCTFGADYYLIKSYRPRTPPRPNVRFVAPIVQREIRNLQPTLGRHVLVYLTKPNPDLVAILHSIDESFVVYCDDRRGPEGNVAFRPRGPGFLEDLGSCKAIIGTTGFSLIGDAIYLRKPYFGIPLKRQFEQTVNALFLAESQFGEYSENPSRAQLVAFLGNLDRYRERLAGNAFDPAEQETALRAILREIQARPPSRLKAVCHPPLAAGPDTHSCPQEKA